MTAIENRLLQQALEAKWKEIIVSTQPTLTSYSGANEDIREVPAGNRFGVWSVVLGLLGFVLLGPISSVPGIVLGYKAVGAVAQGKANNRSLARAGLWLSWIATVVSTALGIYVLASGALSL